MSQQISESRNLNINEKNIGSISFSFSALEPAFK